MNQLPRADPVLEEVMARKEHENTADMKKKLHEYRMAQLKKALEEEKSKKWIYVGNAFKP